MPGPGNVLDVEARWRPLTAEEQDVAEALLVDAWEVLLQQVPGIEARMTAGTLRQGLVVKVQSAMVLRVLRNPDGLRQWSVDDYSATRDQAVSSGLLYLTPEEAAELSAVPAYSAMRGAYTISLGG